MMKQPPLHSIYRHRTFLWALTVCLVVFLFTANLWALDVPPLTARVNDTAHMLSPGVRSQLEAALAQLEQTDSTQIVVLTVPSLDGDSLEDFSIRVAEQWGIGQKGRDNGAILLIARNDRKLRIEVGYGLEGRLTDLVAGRIIRNIIVPQFKAGRIDQGVIQGVSAMASAVRGEFKATGTGGRPASTRGVNPLSGLVFPLIVFLLVMSRLGRLGRVLAPVAGAVLLPMFALLFTAAGWLTALVLIPVGLVAGLVFGLIGAALPVSGGYGRGRSYGGFWGGMGGGGFSSGGGFGGFSGGGGGFGGGGASGGW